MKIVTLITELCMNQKYMNFYFRKKFKKKTIWYVQGHH